MGTHICSHPHLSLQKIHFITIDTDVPEDVNPHLMKVYR